MAHEQYYLFDLKIVVYFQGRLKNVLLRILLNYFVKDIGEIATVSLNAHELYEL